jgi:hypothetical protein
MKYDDYMRPFIYPFIHESIQSSIHPSSPNHPFILHRHIVLTARCSSIRTRATGRMWARKQPHSGRDEQLASHAVCRQLVKAIRTYGDTTSPTPPLSARRSSAKIRGVIVATVVTVHQGSSGFVDDALRSVCGAGPLILLPHSTFLLRGVDDMLQHMSRHRPASARVQRGRSGRLSLHLVTHIHPDVKLHHRLPYIIVNHQTCSGAKSHTHTHRTTQKHDTW